MLYNRISQEHQRICQQISSLQAELANYPAGQLICCHQGTRSKSEAMIDMILYSHRIPFRYECALYLGNHPIFPDFTIRHPQTGETFYWEHFGMMDDALYAQNTASKLQLYISHGIIPSIHLITTYETKDHPLSIEVIQKTVEHYFL